jgi:hypothetical protein
MGDERRGTAQEPVGEDRRAPHEREATDPGAYIGRKPERVAETIPGGLGPADERAAAVDTQSGPRTPDATTPEGHREGPPADDDAVREAGQDR